MLPMTTLPSLLWATVHLYVHSHGPIPHTRSAIKLNSWFYAFISLILFLLICLRPDENLFVRYLYHISKFYEFIDILLVRASGAEIDLHFGVHHVTTPYLTYFRVMDGDCCRGWRAFAGLNTFHHVLMYAFFGGMGGLRGVLPWTGAVQLVVGIMVEGVILWQGRGEGEDRGMFANVVSMGLLGVYLVLFVRDLRMRSVAVEVKEKEKGKE